MENENIFSKIISYFIALEFLKHFTLFFILLKVGLEKICTLYSLIEAIFRSKPKLKYWPRKIFRS